MRKICAVIFGLLVSCQVSAANFTWIGNDPEWNRTTNWTPNTVPGPADTANLSTVTDPAINIPSGTIEIKEFGGIDSPGVANINVTASGYTLQNDRTFASGGFTIGGVGAQGIFGTKGLVIQNNTELTFAGSATIQTPTTTQINNTSAAGGTRINFKNSSSAGNAIIFNQPTGLGTNVINFQDTSNAGTGTIQNQSFSRIDFEGESTAGSTATDTVSIINENNGILNFKDKSSATNSFIQTTGPMTFSGTSTAGNATIFINTGADHFFNAGTNAGTAMIENRGTSTLTFTDSTAANSTIENQSTGLIFFSSDAKGGTSTLKNLIAGSRIEFGNTSNAEMATLENAGLLEFTSSASAGSAMIENKTGATLNFADNATADKATITNQGIMQFLIGTPAMTPTAGESTITNLNLGTISFFKDTTAGTSTITNENALSFTANSDAENATLIQRSTGVTTLASRTEALKLGSLTGEGIINADNNDATLSVGHLNRDETFAGHFQDAAGSVLNVAKEGTGTMILTGQMHTFSGDLDVNTGTLQWEGDQSANQGIGNINIASGATLSGVGSLYKTATNNGTISPGTPTMPFGNLALSSFSGAGTINIAVDPSNNSSLSGSLGANLSNLTLNLDVKAGNYAECTSYPIVGAFGLSTEFLSITGLENLPRFTASVDYTTTPDTATLNLKMVPIIDILNTVDNTGNGDQTTLAGALDGTNTNADFNALIGQLNMFSTEQILQALNQLGTDQFNLNPLSDFFSAEMISEIFADGFESGDNSVWGSAAPYRASFNYLSVRHALTKNRNLHAARFTKAADFFDNALALKDALGAHNRNHVRETISNHAGTGYSWIQGFGSHTDVKQTFDDIGFRANTAGVMLGTDYQLNDKLRVGMGGGYTQTKLKASCNLSESKINSPFFAAWGHYEYGAYDVDLGLTYRHNNYKGKKFITVFNRVADNKHKGFNLMPHLKAARNFTVAKDVTLKPYLGVDYFYSHEDGFTQTGANGLNLKVEKRNSSIIQGKIGTYLDRETEWDCGIMHHGLGVSYKIRKTIGKSKTEATFVGGTTPFVSSRKTPTNHRFGADGHLSFIWDSGAHIKATYHGDFGRKQSAHSGTVSIGKSW